MNACGVECTTCPSFGGACRGCAAEEGKVYWSAYMEEKICPLYACARQKGLTDCGECEKIPCSIWLSLRDPALSEEAFQASVRERLKNLSH